MRPNLFINRITTYSKMTKIMCLMAILVVLSISISVSFAESCDFPRVCNTDTQVRETSMAFKMSPSASHPKRGDTITIWFSVENTGNVTLKNVRVIPAIAGVPAFPAISALEPGVKKAFSAKYVIKQSDPGDVSFVAQAKTDNTITVPYRKDLCSYCMPGEPITIDYVEHASTAVTLDLSLPPETTQPPVVKGASVTITRSTLKSGSRDARKYYKYTVRNNGSVALSNIIIIDNEASSEPNNVFDVISALPVGGSYEVVSGGLTSVKPGLACEVAYNIPGTTGLVTSMCK